MCDFLWKFSLEDLPAKCQNIIRNNDLDAKCFFVCVSKGNLLIHVGENTSDDPCSGSKLFTGLCSHCL